MLASLPNHALEDCLQQLHKAGYHHAQVIGQVVEGQGKVLVL